ncbi:spore morphogenesis/germination protein YwcE [Shouchella sp. JSM 1781072]|uniref:spore morphogenesis/germination protein YwcE n=1 Tax=Bacillaceae TaxID=186817 RepID=UPI000C081301|nr:MULTISPECIES: spore morphogenesis/germination protein YwcE [Bacillaceae]UTR04642.1 spore morphogenesis/germination protein YwcE [Alkalihalobacillus sp. LMS6]
MDMFFAYMFVASATPLFLWLEHRKIAITSIPFILIMWTLAVGFLFDGFLFHITESTFVVAVLINVVIAHAAAFILYASPHVANKTKRITETSE